MNVGSADERVSGIALAIGEPARARMLYCLTDGRARTATELAVVAEVSPSTASVHLQKLKSARLVKVLAQGKHRYYSLEGSDVAAALEALSVLASGGGGRAKFVPTTPEYMRGARKCYDHIAGRLGVQLLDRFRALDWVTDARGKEPDACDVTAKGVKAFAQMGIDVEAARALRRRFAYACVDWSERKPHLGGALAAAVLNAAMKRKWVAPELDSRVLRVTSYGRQEMLARFGLEA